MASTPTLSAWALQKCEDLDLQATRLTWVDEWCPSLVDFIVTIKVDGEIFEGRGMAETEDLAFTKAVAEALERAIMRHANVYSSNGLAVHTTIEEATAGAKRELVERDAFFCHWLTRTPFTGLIDPLIDIKLGNIDIGGRPLADIVERIARLGVDLKIAEMAAVRPYNAFICVSRGSRAPRPFGVHIGMGCDLDPASAIRHAVVEWLRTTVAWCSPGYKGRPAITKAEFDAAPIKGPLHHELLGLSLESLGKLDHLLATEPLAPESNQTIDIDSAGVTITVLKKPNLIADAPIESVQASSSMLQDAFFGYPTIDRVNLARLRQFSGLDLKFEELMHEPHPLG